MTNPLRAAAASVFRSRGGVSVILDEGMSRLSREIVGSQHHGSVGLGLPLEEFARCSLFDDFAEPHELIYALIRPRVTLTFETVHRRGADRAQNYPALIEHRELDDHAIEVVTLHLASLQRHCTGPISGGISPFHVDSPSQSSPKQQPATLPRRFVSVRLSMVLPPERPFHTAAGYALKRFGKLPAIGERFDDQGWRFEIVDLDGRRIDKILARRIAGERRCRQTSN